MGRPGEPRDYRHEASIESEKRKDERAARMRARRAMVKKHGKEALKGKDVDHKKALRHGGSNDMSNLRVRDPDSNRGWRKGAKGYNK